jgi:hypothetical protein
MKRIIMLLTLVAGVGFANSSAAQSKGGEQLPTANPRPQDMNIPETTNRNRLQQQREARDPNTTAITSMKQDTTKPRRDTMRSPQPVPPVPPVPMPPDTMKRAK